MTNTLDQLTLADLDTASGGFSRDVAKATANRWARTGGQWGGAAVGLGTFAATLPTPIGGVAPVLALGGYGVGAIAGASLGWLGGYAYGAYQTRGR